MLDFHQILQDFDVKWSMSKSNTDEIYYFNKLIILHVYSGQIQFEEGFDKKITFTSEKANWSDYNASYMYPLLKALQTVFNEVEHLKNLPIGPSSSFINLGLKKCSDSPCLDKWRQYLEKKQILYELTPISDRNSHICLERIKMENRINVTVDDRPFYARADMSSKFPVKKAAIVIHRCVFSPQKTKYFKFRGNLMALELSINDDHDFLTEFFSSPK